ncbi:MAG: hypothetical protein AAGJ35_10015 [Myxococcota bacterium]
MQSIQKIQRVHTTFEANRKKTTQTQVRLPQLEKALIHETIEPHKQQSIQDKELERSAPSQNTDVEQGADVPDSIRKHAKAIERLTDDLKDLNSEVGSAFQKTERGYKQNKAVSSKQMRYLTTL